MDCCVGLVVGWSGRSTVTAVGRHGQVVVRCARDVAAVRHVDVCRKAYEWPVPFLLLDQLRDLLHADETSFLLQDKRLEYIGFHRGFDPEGFGDDGETVLEARANPFWETYRTSPGCSYPDRSGDSKR